ncbi:hypothetical protein TCAP_05014 [Tolypocladium capitatum]|uniref:Uncharacterized protein n=1 Tax=Tolypocladium capitatum TaxID=45235 RepID=A0A2K3QBX4_9HYPO|nr:hypothetical protein TCAP_05014 [Tolypocladium capitatum]
MRARLLLSSSLPSPYPPYVQLIPSNTTNLRLLPCCSAARASPAADACAVPKSTPRRPTIADFNNHCRHHKPRRRHVRDPSPPAGRCPRRAHSPDQVHRPSLHSLLHRPLPQASPCLALGHPPRILRRLRQRQRLLANTTLILQLLPRPRPTARPPPEDHAQRRGRHWRLLGLSARPR